MKISEHFMREEFDCRDGTPYPKEWIEKRLKPLCKALEVIREKSGVIHILSGYRTPEHNTRVGGAKRSMHMYGIAVDMACRELAPKKLHQLILDLIKNGKIKDGGVGLYHSWVHYDQRTKLARWTGQ